MPSRRHFLARLAVAGASLPALPAFRPDAFARLLRAEPATAGRTPRDLADDESYWTRCSAPSTRTARSST